MALRLVIKTNLTILNSHKTETELRNTKNSYFRWFYVIPDQFAYFWLKNVHTMWFFLHHMSLYLLFCLIILPSDEKSKKFTLLSIENMNCLGHFLSSIMDFQGYYFNKLIEIKSEHWGGKSQREVCAASCCLNHAVSLSLMNPGMVIWTFAHAIRALSYDKPCSFSLF